MIKQIIISAFVALVVSVGYGLVSDNQSTELGATGTRFPYGISTNTNSPSSGQVVTTTFGLATTTASGLSAGAAGATSTVNLGRVCYKYEKSDASGAVYYWIGPSGNVASSTSSCN